MVCMLLCSQVMVIRTRSDGLRFQGQFRLGNSKNIHWDVALGDTVSEHGGVGLGVSEVFSNLNGSLILWFYEREYVTISLGTAKSLCIDAGSIWEEKGFCVAFPSHLGRWWRSKQMAKLTKQKQNHLYVSISTSELVAERKPLLPVYSTKQQVWMHLVYKQQYCCDCREPNWSHKIHLSCQETKINWIKMWSVLGAAVVWLFVRVGNDLKAVQGDLWQWRMHVLNQVPKSVSFSLDLWQNFCVYFVLLMHLCYFHMF